jgi:hypothetical protein
MNEHAVDGREAYRDDPEYTAPEMEPHETTDELPAEGDAEVPPLALAALPGIVAGDEATEPEADRRDDESG